MLSIFILFRNTFKVYSQYLFSLVLLLKTFFYLKIITTLKIDPQTCHFENLKEISQKLEATLHISSIMAYKSYKMCKFVRYLFLFSAKGSKEFCTHTKT